MASIEERVSRLEGAYEHMATKAELVQLRGDFREMSYLVEGLTRAIQRAIERLDDLEQRPPRRVGFGTE